MENEVGNQSKEAQLDESYMIETIKEIGDGMHAKIYLAHKKSLNQNCND